MNDQDTKKLIASYLDAAGQHKIRPATETHQQQELFAKVISDLGLSEEEQEALSKHGQNQLKLAREQLSNGRLVTALSLAEEAQSLLPFDAAPTALLLRIHQQNNNQQKIRACAEHLLKLNPDHQLAHDALNKLRQQPKISPLWRAIWLTLLVGYPVLLGINWLLDNGTETSHTPEVPPLQAKPEAAAELTAAKVTQNNPANVSDSSTQVLEVIHPTEDLVWIDGGTKLSHFPDTMSAQLKLTLANKTDQEIGTIKAVIELRDQAGATHYSSTRELRPSYAPPLRPGQSAGLQHLIFVKTEELSPEIQKTITNMKVTFSELELRPTAKAVSLKSVELIWPEQKPEQFILDVQQELSSFKHNPLLKQWSVKPTFQITNKGDGVIRTLKLRLEVLSKDNQLIEQQSQLITYSSLPMIQPGETWLGYFLLLTSVEPQSTRLVVEEIE